MMHARPGRLAADDPDRHGWWTVRFAWPDQHGDTRAPVAYTMTKRPTRAAAVNCAASVLYRGRTRGLAVVHPLQADVKGPGLDRWCPIPPPELRAVSGER
jgi:hypothetical protein